MSNAPDFEGLEQFLIDNHSGKRKGKEIELLCPFHDDNTPSASYSTELKALNCFACNYSCGYVDLAKKIGFDLYGQSKKSNSSKKTSSKKGSNSKGKSKVVTAYDYHDENGETLFHVERTEDKKFFQRLAGQREYGLDGKVFDVIYKLPQVLEAISKGEQVFIVEGEKDVHTLEELGLVATCNPMGAGKWNVEAAKKGKDYSKWLKGAHLVLIPDNDDAGRDHVIKISETLKEIKSLKVLILPDLQEKGDVTDWLEQLKS